MCVCCVSLTFICFFACCNARPLTVRQAIAEIKHKKGVKLDVEMGAEDWKEVSTELKYLPFSYIRDT